MEISIEWLIIFVLVGFILGMLTGVSMTRPHIVR